MNADMRNDPIVEEIHVAREQISHAYNSCLKQIPARLRKLEAQYLERLIHK